LLRGHAERMALAAYPNNVQADSFVPASAVQQHRPTTDELHRVRRRIGPAACHV